MKLSKKQEQAVENYIRQRMEEKAGPRPRSKNEIPPVAPPQLSKTDERAVDAELRRMMRPDKPRA